MKKRHQYLIRYAIFIMVLAILALGCRHHGGGGAVAPSGTVTQGAVKNALVYADHVTGTEANYRMDAGDEEDSSTMTDDNGNFTLATVPAYDYRLVSQDGTDTITDQPAMVMLAPAGARNITPFTTMVALNPAAKDVIELLGIPYDADLSKTVTPAALLLLQSTQQTIVAATDSLNTGGNSLSLSDINDIHLTLLTEIASEVASGTVGKPSNAPISQAMQAAIVTSLTNTTTLTSKLTSAVTRALTTITNNNPSITIVNISQVSQDIVGPIVTTISDIIATSTNSFSFSTTTIVAENTIITNVAVTNIKTTNTGVVGKVTLSVTVIPAPDVAPFITGTPSTTANVGVPYSFRPTVTDADADVDVMIYSITNKPAWAKFNIGTGALTGTPKTADIGTTTGIVISVQDGVNIVALPPFDLTVGTAVLQSITVTPANPTIATGTTQQFIATGTFSDSSTQDLTTSVAWSSSNGTVATIRNGGRATGVALGATTITATSSTAAGKISGSTTLTVSQAALVSIAVTPADPTLAKGTTQQFTATGTFTDSSTQDLTSSVTWQSSNAGLVTISSKGLAGAVSAGTVTITARSSTATGSIVGSTTMTVTAATLVSIAITPADTSIAPGFTGQFTATGTFSDATTQVLNTSVTWSSSNAAVATVNSTGLASAVSAGTVTISATSSIALGSKIGTTTLIVSLTGGAGGGGGF